MAATLAFTAALRGDAGNAPLAFLEPVVVLEASDMARLRAGKTFVSVLPGRDGHLAVTAIVGVETGPDLLAEWTRRVGLQKGRYVESIGRFSFPPRLDDVAGLTVDETDLEDLRECRPGDCQVKLSAAEMAAMGRAGGAGLQLAFRELLVRRATDYLRSGDCALAPYADDDEPVLPALVFDSLLDRMAFLPRRFPRLVEYLRGFPHLTNPEVTDSFLYWSKETLGFKPIVSVTHVTIARVEAVPLPEVVVIAKQVFASHYRNGSLTMTAIAGRDRERYLVYLLSADVDALQGFLGGVARQVLERRVKDEAPGVLLGLRQQLQNAQFDLGGMTRPPDGR